MCPLPSFLRRASSPRSTGGTSNRGASAARGQQLRIVLVGVSLPRTGRARSRHGRTMRVASCSTSERRGWMVSPRARSMSVLATQGCQSLGMPGRSTICFRLMGISSGLAIECPSRPESRSLPRCIRADDPTEFPATERVIRSSPFVRRANSRAVRPHARGPRRLPRDFATRVRVREERFRAR